MLNKFLLILLIFSLSLFAQDARIDNRNIDQRGMWTANLSRRTSPFRIVTSVPGTCTTKEVVQIESTGKLYYCQSTNVFVEIGDGNKVLMFEVFEDATALAIGDGKIYIPIPSLYAGWNIIAVSAHLGSVVSSSGAVTVDIARCAAVATGIRCSGTVADVLSTNLTVDANEDGSETAETAAVIDTSNDDLPTSGHLRVDVDGAGTGTKGLIVQIVIQKP